MSRKRAAPPEPTAATADVAETKVKKQKKLAELIHWLAKMEVVFPNKSIENVQNPTNEQIQAHQQFTKFLKLSLEVTQAVFESSDEINWTTLRHLYGNYYLKELEEKLCGKPNGNNTNELTGLTTSIQYVAYKELFDEYFIKLVDNMIPFCALSKKTDDDCITKVLHFAEICGGFLYTYSPNAHIRLVERAKSILQHLLNDTELFREQRRPFYRVNLSSKELQCLLFGKGTARHMSQLSQSSNSSCSSSGSSFSSSGSSHRWQPMKAVNIPELAKEGRSNVMALCLRVISVNKVDFETEWNSHKVLREIYLNGRPSILRYLIEIIANGRITSSTSKLCVVNIFRFLFSKVRTDENVPERLRQISRIISLVEEKQKETIFDIILQVWPYIVDVMNSSSDNHANYLDFASEMLGIFKDDIFSRTTRYRVGLLFWSIHFGRPLYELIPEMRTLFSRIFQEIKDGSTSATEVLEVIRLAFEDHVTGRISEHTVNFEAMIAVFLLEYSKIPNERISEAKHEFDLFLKFLFEIKNSNFHKNRSQIAKVIKPLKEYLAASESELKIDLKIDSTSKEMLSSTIQRLLVDISNKKTLASDRRKKISSEIQAFYTKGM